MNDKLLQAGFTIIEAEETLSIDLINMCDDATKARI